MSAQIITFPGKEAVIQKLQAAATELRLVVETETDSEAASDLWVQSRS
jgi:hypothetical protein